MSGAARGWYSVGLGCYPAEGNAAAVRGDRERMRASTHSVKVRRDGSPAINSQLNRASIKRDRYQLAILARVAGNTEAVIARSGNIHRPVHARAVCNGSRICGNGPRNVYATAARSRSCSRCAPDWCRRRDRGYLLNLSK